MHYKSNPLKSPTFEQTLAEPVPQQNSHLGKTWFHENLSRTEAEEMLKKVRMDGAFLIRPSEHNPSKAGQKNYAISFRCVCVCVCACMRVCICMHLHVCACMCVCVC